MRKDNYRCKLKLHCDGVFFVSVDYLFSHMSSLPFKYNFEDIQIVFQED